MIFDRAVLLSGFVLNLFVGGCASLKPSLTADAVYDSGLTEVFRPEDTVRRYGTGTTMFSSEDSSDVFEDDLVRVTLFVDSPRVHFEVFNRTAYSTRILWEDAVFIDLAGRPGRVIHGGVAYADRNAYQPPSVVPALASLADFALPVDRIHMQEYFDRVADQYTVRWEATSFIQPVTRRVRSGDSALNAFRVEAQGNAGRRFGLLLPVENRGVVNEYTFWFEVRNTRVTTTELPSGVQRPR